MKEKINIVIGGLVAGLIAVGVAEIFYSFTNEFVLGRLITIVLTLITTGLLYAIIYTTTDAQSGGTEGIYAGIFAGAVGGILCWAIGESFFGPLQTTGLLITGLIGGFLFSVQIEPKWS